MEVNDLRDQLDGNLTVSIWPTAARALGVGRSTAYEAAREGTIKTIKVGRKLRVPTAWLKAQLGLGATQ
jgi:excisionase family DNA binding protein